jgi:hypothetical protein
MDTYTFFIEDDRYSVPTLEFVLVPDKAKARQMASERLIASRHHLSVIVHQHGRQVFQVSRAGRDGTVEGRPGI